MPERFRMTEGWLSFALLFLLLFVVTISLESAKWAPGLDILFGVFLMALLVGVVFAKSRLSGVMMHPLSLLIGAGWIGFVALSLTTVGPWEDQVAELVLRLIEWGNALSSRQATPDTLPFVLLMAALVWIISYSGAWFFFRDHNVWGVLLPAGMTILVNTYYASTELTMLLVIWLVLAFLFVIRTHLLEQEQRWQQRHIAYSPDIHFDFFRDGAIFAVTVVALAWLLPNALDRVDANPLLTRIGQPWGRAQQEWNRLFSALNYQGTGGSGAWFGTSMSFRGPLNRSDRLVMSVRAPQGRYWRAVVLDEYTSAGWTVSEKRVASEFELEEMYDPERPLPGRELIGQQYTIYSPAGTLLFAAGQPLEVTNLDTQVLVGGDWGGDAVPPVESVFQLYAEQPLYQGQSYSAISAIPIVDQSSLSQAGTAYPSWISEEYLALPDTVPQRVFDLAQELAGEAESPYAAAKTVEQYLRGIPYNELIPGPNPGEDGVDYFLFREKQGYCDYYASSMAVMLRSLGVPARLAQGYSRGTLLPSGEYEVRQTNAHTWVEVYFPGYGWVEFEPTAAEPSLERPLVAEEDVASSSLPATDASSNEQDILNEMEELRRLREEQDAALAEAERPGILSVRIDPRLLLVPLGVLAAAGLIAAAGWGLMERRWQGLGLIERIFDQVSLFGRAVGQKPNPTLTPREYAARVGEQVPPARSPLERLADLFSKYRFSGRPLADDEAAEADASWQEARRTLARSALGRLVPKRRTAVDDASEAEAATKLWLFRKKPDKKK